MHSHQNSESFGPSEHGIWYERLCWMDDKLYRHELAISPELFQLGLARMREGMVIQDAFPTLSPQDREFILSGLTPQRWNELFPPAPPLDQPRINQILKELAPIISSLFGDNKTKPLDLEALTAEAIRDYPDLDEATIHQAREWVQNWAGQKGLITPV